MQLEIYLSSTLRKYHPDYDPLRGIQMEVDGTKTVADICAEIGIPADRVKVVMVNGRNASLEYTLTGDERVALFPPVGGG